MVISHTLFRRRLLFCGAKRSIISTADRRATFLALFHGHLLFWSGLRGRLFYRFFLTLFRDCFFLSGLEVDSSTAWWMTPCLSGSALTPRRLPRAPGMVCSPERSSRLHRYANDLASGLRFGPIQSPVRVFLFGVFVQGMCVGFFFFCENCSG